MLVPQLCFLRQCLIERIGEFTDPLVTADVLSRVSNADSSFKFGRCERLATCGDAVVVFWI